MLNLYSIFVHYVLFFQKKLPPLPPIFQLMWGVLPSLPLSETAPVEDYNIKDSVWGEAPAKFLTIIFENFELIEALSSLMFDF